MNKIDISIYDNLDPLPEDTTGWGHEDKIFEELIEKAKPSVIVEVGTWKGASAIRMGEILREKKIDCRIYCVDTWLGAKEFWTNLADTPERNLMLRNGYPQIYYQFLSNVVHRNLQNYILPLPMPSATAAEVLNHFGVKADLIYIDASHEYKDVKEDILNFLGILNGGKIIFGHDFGIFKGVEEAVKEVFQTNYRTTESSFWIHES